MKIDPATNPAAGDVARVPAMEVATGHRAIFLASTSHHPMLRGPRIAFAPDTDDGAAAGGESTAGAEADTDPDRMAAPEGDAEADGEGEGGEDGDDGDKSAADDDTEEVEHEGQKHKVPKALKPLLMMQRDYTQKTQELAETRKSLETERTAWQSQQAAERERIAALSEDYGKIHTLKAQAAAFAEIDWAEVYQEAGLSENPGKALAEANAAKARFDGIKSQLAEAETALKDKTAKFETDQREARAKAIQDVGVILAKEIPDFSREKAGKLIELAGSRGVSVEEMQQADDPRSWLLLNDLHDARAKIADLEAQLSGARKVQDQEKAQGAKPATSVSARTSPPTGPDDRNTTDNWMAKRNAALAAKRQAGRR